MDDSPQKSCFSEGTHAKHHYMICGVQGILILTFMCCNSHDGRQGDFTRGLVNDPPRTLWTRDLKVSRGGQRAAPSLSGPAPSGL